MLKKRSVLEQLGLLQNEQDETVLFLWKEMVKF